LRKFKQQVDPTDGRTLLQVQELVTQAGQIESQAKRLTQDVQDEHGGHTRLIAYYEDTLKTLEFKSGLSQGLTTGAGPYKGKQFAIAE